MDWILSLGLDLRQMKFISVLAFLVLFSCVSLGATKERPTGRVWVNLESDSIAWKVRAIKGTIFQFLSSFEQVNIVQNLQVNQLGCSTKDLKCLLRSLASKRVDIAILGKFDGKTLDLKSYETWSGTEVSHSMIVLTTDVSLTEFRHRVFRLVQPFIDVGGLLDRFYAKSKPPAPYRVNFSEHTAVFVHIIIALILGFLFWLPFLVVKRLSKKMKVPFPKKVAHRKYRIAAALGVPILWGLGAYYGPTVLALMEHSIPSTRYIIGGTLWASVLIIFQRFAIPPLSLIEKTSFANLSVILRTWLNVLAVKTFIFILAFLPMMGLLYLLDQWINWDVVTTWTIMIPASLAAGFLWYLFWVAELTFFLDPTFVYGFRRNELQWEREIKKYFRGYINRLGVSINDRLIEKTKFLPSKRDGIYSYGGGFVPRRVLISSLMLAYSMGTLKDDSGDEDQGFANYQAGIIFPKRRRKSQSDFEIPTNFFTRTWRRYFSDDEVQERDIQSHASRNFNLHNATILGYVVPANPDVAVPLISNNREDFEAVGELLTEHYADFDKDQVDLELDDSDPTDMDFLFGALLREFMVLEQNEHFLLTFYHAFNLVAPKFPERVLKIIETCRSHIRRHFSRFTNELADAYVALNMGRHYLVQYLFYSLDRKSRLTVRADSGTLYSVTRQILDEVQNLPRDEEDNWPDNATVKNRINWLATNFFKTQSVKASHAQPWLGVVAIATLFIAITLIFVGESVQYHDVYNERIELMKERIELAKQIKEKQERDNVGK